MANKSKKHIPNNLLKIRQELKFTQKEMGAILGLSERQICNYEIDENSNLPIDKAMIISEKYNYSLDWIYCNSSLKKIQPVSSNRERERINFLVDLRDYIYMSDNTQQGEKKEIFFTISKNYWEYLNKKYEINSSSDSIEEKERAIKKLDGSYKNSDTATSWKFVIPYDKFFRTMNWTDPCLPFITSEDIALKGVSSEQVEKAAMQLKTLLENNCDNNN